MRFSFPFLLSHKRGHETMYQPTQCGVPTNKTWTAPAGPRTGPEIQTGPDRTDWTRHQTRPDLTRPTGMDRTSPDQTRLDRTRPDRTRLDQTGPDRTGPDHRTTQMECPDQTRLDHTRPDRRTGRPDQAGPDRTGPD
jgi:hypothetical protein